MDALFDQARVALDASEWTVAIDNLLALRKADPTYRSVDVDGMLYLALRNRGVDKILRSSDLESGTYDLALAERFGPLDVEAHNYRIWVNLYVTGASFWDIDWAQAVYYFSQLYPLAPGLRDASGWTVADRYSIALRSYGDAIARDDDWCQAQELYESALAVSGDPALQELAEEAARNCSRGGNGGENNDQGGEGEPEPPSNPEPEPTDSSPRRCPSIHDPGLGADAHLLDPHDRHRGMDRRPDPVIVPGAAAGAEDAQRRKPAWAADAAASAFRSGQLVVPDPADRHRNVPDERQSQL